MAAVVVLGEEIAIDTEEESVRVAATSDYARPVGAVAANVEGAAVPEPTIYKIGRSVLDITPGASRKA